MRENDVSTKRECGDCGLCCKVMGVLDKGDIFKAPGVWCPHCPTRHGCGIYDTRPEECREFECLWLFDATAIPENLKPNKTHVVLSTTIDGSRLVANVDPTYPDAAYQGEMGAFLFKISQVMDVIIMIGDKRKLMTTEDRKDAALAVIRGQR